MKQTEHGAPLECMYDVKQNLIFTSKANENATIYSIVLITSMFKSYSPAVPKNLEEPFSQECPINQTHAVRI